MDNLVSIERELNRSSRFICRFLRSSANCQIFGDLLFFHLKVVLHHLDEANWCLARWKDSNCVDVSD